MAEKADRSEVRCVEELYHETFSHNVRLLSISVERFFMEIETHR